MIRWGIQNNRHGGRPSCIHHVVEKNMCRVPVVAQFISGTIGPTRPLFSLPLGGVNISPRGDEFVVPEPIAKLALDGLSGEQVHCTAEEFKNRAADRGYVARCRSRLQMHRRKIFPGRRRAYGAECEHSQARGPMAVVNALIGAGVPADFKVAGGNGPVPEGTRACGRRFFARARLNWHRFPCVLRRLNCGSREK